MGLPEKNWLKPGDIVKVGIDKLGYWTTGFVISPYSHLQKNST